MSIRRRIWVLLIVIAASSAQPAEANNLTVTSKSLTVERTCILTASSSTSVVAADSSVREGNGTTNYGSLNSVNVTSQTSVNRRTYIRFDLTKCSPAIPSTASVELATLRLFISQMTGVCRTHDIFKVGAAWTETGLTWNNQPFGTTQNNPATASRTASLDEGTPTGCQNPTNNSYVSGWNVTTDVQSFVSGASTNNGWMIRDDAEASSTGRATTYSTREINDVTQAPQLIVTY
jgi:hypothetical protein